MKLTLTLFVAAALLPGAGAARADVPATRPVIFVCGDSTAKNAGKGKNGSPLVGWGTPIAEFFDPARAVVNNVAHGGRSSLTYYNGDWPRVLPKINAGDFVLLVFGINDGTTPGGIDATTRPGPGGQARHTYGWYMAKMATDARDRGAHVYFLTVTVRDIWTNPRVKFSDGTPVGPLPADYDPAQDKIERGTGGGKYTLWTRDVARNLHLPVFDLTNYSADVYEKMGREQVMKLYSDHNHTYQAGAEIVASCIVSGLKAFKDSPFIPLLSEKGKALPTADAKYVAQN